MNKKGVIYFKMILSYGEPTELDNTGCDGMYVESVEKTLEFNKLIDLSREILRDGLTVNRRGTLRGIIATFDGKGDEQDG